MESLALARAWEAQTVYNGSLLCFRAFRCRRSHLYCLTKSLPSRILGSIVCFHSIEPFFYSLIYILIAFVKMSGEQRKAVIKNADMTDQMQQDAVDVASKALSDYNIEKVRVSSLVCCIIILKSSSDQLISGDYVR